MEGSDQHSLFIKIPTWSYAMHEFMEHKLAMQSMMALNSVSNVPLLNNNPANSNFIHYVMYCCCFMNHSPLAVFATLYTRTVMDQRDLITSCVHSPLTRVLIIQVLLLYVHRSGNTACNERSTSCTQTMPAFTLLYLSLCFITRSLTPSSQLADTQLTVS